VIKFVRAMLVMAMLVGVGAQAASAQTIGFKVGPTFSKLSFEDDVSDEDEDTESLTSFGGGGFIRFGFAGLALQAEVLAFTKGAQSSFDDGTTAGDTKVKLGYIEIPLTAMFSLGSGPYVFAGPAVAFEIGCELEFDTDEINVEGDCDEEDTDSDRKKTDFSLHGGAGFEFPVGPGRLLIEGRYIYGLSNLNDDDITEDDVSGKNRTWAIMAGFAIPIGR
jgi:hypothetical protein